MGDISRTVMSSCVRQFSAQVAGSSEKMSELVVPISAPSTMIRPASKAVYLLVS
jgi:putative methionine-R-sulfoxide reductase with GAF domain